MWKWSCLCQTVDWMYMTLLLVMLGYCSLGHTHMSLWWTWALWTCEGLTARLSATVVRFVNPLNIPRLQPPRPTPWPPLPKGFSFDPLHHSCSAISYTCDWSNLLFLMLKTKLKYKSNKHFYKWGSRSEFFKWIHETNKWHFSLMFPYCFH